MFYELIQLCSSLNGVITVKQEVVHQVGSDDCSKYALCKFNLGNGFRYKEARGNQDLTVTNCEALKVHYRRWGYEEIINRISLDALGEIQQAISALQTATCAISEKVETVKIGRRSLRPSAPFSCFFSSHTWG